jgi:hypothetical protein
MQIIFLCRGNVIPRICIIQRWYQTADKKGTSDSCTNAAKKCQRVIEISWHGPIQQRHLGTMKQNAGSTIQFGWGAQTHQSHKGKQNQKGDMALGQDPLAGI